jgi:EmrB/QacA subfamily drug resistance transporter
MDDLDTSPSARTGNTAVSDEATRAEQRQPSAATDTVAAACARAPSKPATFQPLARSEVLTVLWGVFLGMFLAAINQTIVAAALPTIGRDLKDFENLSWVITAYLLTSTAVAPLYGKLADIYGRRAMMLIGIGGFLAGSAICAVAPTMPVLVLGRALQGVGGGGLLPLAQIIVADVVLPRERGRYQGYIGMVWVAAGVAGPVVGGAISEHLHWSLIFWINVPIAIAGAAISSATLKRLPRYERRHALDVFGATLMVLAAVALFLALTWGGVRYSWTSLPIVGLVVLSGLLWGGFAMRLATAPEPFLPLSILANPVVRMACLSSACAVGTSIGLTVFVPLYYEVVHKLSASDSGLALIPIAVMTVPGTILAGRGMMHLDHYKRIPIVFMVVSLVTTLWLAAAPALPLAAVVTMLGVIAFGLGTVFPVATVSLQNSVPLHQVGTATGVMNFFRALNSALIVAVMGAIVLAGFGVAPERGRGAELLIHAMGAQGIDHTSVFRWVFFAAAAFIAFGIAALLWLEERPLRGAGTPIKD